MVSSVRSPALNDPAPPYLARCREMDFGQLRKFIDDALDELPDGGPRLPGTEPEFVVLADMLDAKLDALEADIPDLPPRPAPPPVERPSSAPSEALVSARNGHRVLRTKLERAWAYGSSTKREIREIESRLRDLEHEIEEREAGEEQRYAEQMAAYREARFPYEAADVSWLGESSRIAGIHDRIRKRRRIVERIRSYIDRAFQSGVVTRSSSFPFLPSGKLSPDQVRGYFRDVQRRNPSIRYDEGRIGKMLSLGPSELRQHGATGFDGYTLCRFPYTESVLLECPWVGNAIYVIHGDWERKAGKNKQELRSDTSGDVAVIPHQGDDWFAKVMQELGTPPGIDDAHPESEAS